MTDTLSRQISTTSSLKERISVKRNLPPAWPHDLSGGINELRTKGNKVLVVLDDDPTGTQTVYGVPVLTIWDVPILVAELQRSSCFYILTNSRSLPPLAAKALNHEIASNLKVASEVAGYDFIIGSRSDSTLRGHFPLETETLSEVLGPYDGTVLVPYFEEGGRITVEDEHYLVQGSQWIPASETVYSRDAVFGYRSSNLREWIQEKAGRNIPDSKVVSISIKDIREQGPAGLYQTILKSEPGAVFIVNAQEPTDLAVSVAAFLRAENKGKRFLYRTAASFVKTWMGLSSAQQPVLPVPRGQDTGGLIIVGSYVSTTTAQLEYLLARGVVVGVELNAGALLGDARQSVISEAVAKVNEALLNREDVCLFTSRELLTADGAAENLGIGNAISEALVDVVQRLKTTPRFIIAKGGITASDVAKKGLGVRRAMVLGALLPGVPVWELGAESKYPALTFIVFPGNVGGPDALVKALEALS